MFLCTGRLFNASLRQYCVSFRGATINRIIDNELNIKLIDFKKFGV